MQFEKNNINPGTSVKEIVTQNHRAADVFWKYNIEFCCNGIGPLDVACRNLNLDTSDVMNELERVSIFPANAALIDFDEWEIDFLSDYILNVHHRYLKKTLPLIKDHVNRFIEGHKQKYPELAQLETILKKLMKEIPPHMQEEEEIIFPYIRQIHHAHQHRESYARLLVRTLRQPVEEIMLGEHEAVISRLMQMRKFTNDYTPPANACLTHKVVFSKLQELDNDLVQHIHLETDILFPKAIAMEKELLEQD
jgi:regulator of cell morphogenesis and NO signaling